MLNTVGDSTASCGTPGFVFLCLDLCLSNCAYCFFPLMQFAMNFVIEYGISVFSNLSMSVCK